MNKCSVLSEACLPAVYPGKTSKDLNRLGSEAKAQKYRRQPSKASLIKPHTQPHTQTHANSTLPGGRAVCAAAGVDDWLVVIETAKGKFLPDGLSLISLGLSAEK